MNFRRALFIFTILLGSLIATNGFSQEAVGDRPSPSPEETQVEEQAAEPSVETPSDEAKPRKKSTPAPKDAEEKPARGIDAMTPEQFKAAGLDKLSPEELKNLDASLKGYQAKVETKAVEKATAVAEKKAEAKIKAQRKNIDRIESRVAGTIDRVTGHSIITLEDGSRWKQANPDDRYRAQVPDHPRATVEHSAFGYKMRISGLPDLYVDPVRQ